jgi:uncharacterized alpha-E superfamily protein
MMPGGLTRVSASPDGFVVSMQRGGGSKDTWVQSAGPVNTFSLLAQGGPVELTRAGGDLPSRAADNLYWLGRYAERADGLTRLLRGIVVRLAEPSDITDSPEVPALLRALSLRTQTQLANPSQPVHPIQEVLTAVYDDRRPDSLAAVVQMLIRVAGTVRDRISIDMWRVINGLSDFPSVEDSSDDNDPHTFGEVHDLLNRVVLTLAAFGGLTAESMTRGEGWRFLDMGRKLERAVHMVHLLRGTLVSQTEQEGPVLEAVLEIAESSMTYRRRYLGSLRTEAVLDLLVSDETNPRSLASQLQALLDHVDHLPRPVARAGRGPEQRQILVARNAVQLAEPERLAAVENGTRPALRDLLAYLAEALPGFSDLVTQEYLSHLLPSRHLAAPEFVPPIIPGRTGRPEL